MKRIPENDLPEEAEPQLTSNLKGFVELGMKREALKLAHHIFKQADITPDTFLVATRALVILADKCKPWTPAVEAAYTRMSTHDKQAVRHAMLYFYYSSKKYEIAAKFTRRRFAGEIDPLELAITCETWLKLNRMDKMDRLAKTLQQAIKEADYPFGRIQLMNCLAEYSAQKRQWNKALELWRVVARNEVFCQEAIEGIMGVFVRGAIRTLEKGLETVKKFSQDFDPGMEIKLPGNNKAMRKDAEKKFRKLHKLLIKVLPEKRRKELGLDV